MISFKKQCPGNLIIYVAAFFVFCLHSQTVPAAENGKPDIPAQIQTSLNRILEDKPTSTFGFTTIQADPSAVDRVLLSLYLKDDIQPYWVSQH